MYEVLLLTEDINSLPEYLLQANQEVTYLVLDKITPNPSTVGYTLTVRELTRIETPTSVKSIKATPEFNNADTIEYNSFTNLFNINNIHEVILKYNELPKELEYPLMLEVSKRDISISFRGYFESTESELVMLNNEGIFIFEFNSNILSYPYQAFEAKTVPELELYTLMEFADTDILTNQTFIMITLDDNESPKLISKESLTEAISALDYLKERNKPVEVMLVKKVLNPSELLALYEEFKNG